MALIAVHVINSLKSQNFVMLLCFLDEDEVGDRITVRSDEELKAMLSYVSINICFFHHPSPKIFFFSVVAVFLSAFSSLKKSFEENC